MGEFIAWIIGWDLILEYALGATTVAIGWSGYVVSFLKRSRHPICRSPRQFAARLRSRDRRLGRRPARMLNVPAMFIVAAISALLVVGMHESASVNNVIVVIKVAIVIAFIVAGLRYISTRELGDRDQPARRVHSAQHQGPAIYGWSGVLRGAAVVFFAYIGFDAVSTAAQEANNPQRDMPIGILGSLAICTLLYVLVSFVITGIIPYDKLNVPDPIAVGVDAIGLTWLSPIIKLGAIAGLTSVILVLLLGQPRIFYAMARDGLLPPLGADDPQALPHALHHDDRHRRDRRDPRRPAADRARRRARQHRHAVCLRDRLPRRARPAHHAARLERPFKAPAIYFVAPAGALRGLPHARTARRHLGAPRRLAVRSGSRSISSTACATAASATSRNRVMPTIPPSSTSPAAPKVLFAVV